MKTTLTSLVTVSMFLALMCVAGESPETFGRRFFVSRQHPDASDDHPGTWTQPWRTIGGNLARLQAGDTVCVRSGVYREQVVLRADGWKWARAGIDVPPVASGLHFMVWPGDDVLIKGSDVVTDWTLFRDAIWRVEAWPHNSQQVFADGEILQQIGGEMAGGGMTDYWRGRVGDGVADMQPGSFFYDREPQNLYVWLADDGDPNEHRMEVSVRPFLFSVGVSETRVSGFRMMHANVSAYVNWAAVGLGGSGNILEDVEVTWTDFIALGVGGSRNTVLRSRFNHNGNTGISGSGWGHRIIDCETSHNNYRHWSGGWGAGGMKIIPFAHDWVVSGHTAAHNINSPGIWFDAWMSNVTIRNSLAHHNGTAGIFYEIGSRGVIKNNIVYRNGHRGIYVADSADTLVAHNLAIENGMSGIAVVGTGRRGGRFGREEDEVLWSRNNVVWGNILVDNCLDEARDLERFAGWGNRAELILPDDKTANRNNHSDYNVFFRSDGRVLPFFRGWGAENYATLDAWREATGNDRHSVVAEPLFVDRAAGDFRPAENSPAAARVRPHMSVRFDFKGRDRPGDADFTAGPFEIK